MADHAPMTTRLRDGTKVLIRPIEPDDKERLQAGLAELSPRSRYLRFMMPVDHLTAEQLRYLTEIDYADHMAWVALNVDAPDEPGMGVARYVRLREEPEIAEAAVTVADRYQNRGLGTLLLMVLARTAIANGIRTFRNYVLAENEAMLEVFNAFGTVTRTYEGEGVFCVDVPLPEDPDELELSSPTRLLRESARGNLPELLLRFPLTGLARDLLHQVGRHKE